MKPVAGTEPVNDFKTPAIAIYRAVSPVLDVAGGLIQTTSGSGSALARSRRTASTPSRYSDASLARRLHRFAEPQLLAIDETRSDNSTAPKEVHCSALWSGFSPQFTLGSCGLMPAPQPCHRTSARRRHPRIGNIGSGGTRVLGEVAWTIQCVFSRPTQITARPELHNLSGLFCSHEHHQVRLPQYAIAAAANSRKSPNSANGT